MKGGAGEGIEDSGKGKGERGTPLSKGAATTRRTTKDDDDGGREHTHDLIYRSHDRMSRMRPVESVDTPRPSICTSAYSDPDTRSQQLWLRSVVSRILRIRTSTRSVFSIDVIRPRSHTANSQSTKPEPQQHV